MRQQTSCNKNSYSHNYGCFFVRREQTSHVFTATIITTSINNDPRTGTKTNIFKKQLDTGQPRLFRRHVSREILLIENSNKNQLISSTKSFAVFVSTLLIQFAILTLLLFTSTTSSQSNNYAITTLQNRNSGQCEYDEYTKI